MKIKLPFYTPKDYIDTYKLMRQVKPHEDYMKMLKQRRHNAYLSHSMIGYKVPETPKTLQTRAKEFWIKLKDVIASFDAED